MELDESTTFLSLLPEEIRTKLKMEVIAELDEEKKKKDQQEKKKKPTLSTEDLVDILMPETKRKK